MSVFVQRVWCGLLMPAGSPIQDAAAHRDHDWGGMDRRVRPQPTCSCMWQTGRQVLQARPLTMNEHHPHACVLCVRRQMAEAEAWANRRAMLRTIASQLLSALDFVHSADCVHGSLSTGTGRSGGEMG